MDLRGRDRAGLERLYANAPLGPAPAGVWRGEFLCWLDTRGARRALVRAMDTLLFRWPRWGIDFDERRWWFVTPRWQAGRFVVASGGSRWRPPTETLRLRYDPSRLPVRDLLYDEVKPLAADVCLGIGGTNDDAGDGDHFFFGLWRRPPG